MFTGTTDLAGLGENLSAFVKTAKDFFVGVVDFPDEGIEKSPRILAALENLGGYATKTGGVAQMFTGTTDLAGLGNNLSAFVKTAVDFFLQ